MENAIKKYLDQNGMKPSELARLMGVSPSTVIRHMRPREEGGRGISWAMAQRYVEQGISYEELAKDFARRRNS